MAFYSRDCHSALNGGSQWHNDIMKLIINKNQIEGAAEQFLRRAGYGYIRDRQRGKESFVRRLGSGFYPRLHMYAQDRGEQIIFDLHLDQKQASYQGSHMHNAEYEGEIVKVEIERLKSLLEQEIRNTEQGTRNKEHRTGNRDGSEDLLDRIGPGKLPAKAEKPAKKSWWRRLF